jgi:branched-chain amino acid transport system substrate-binding protein
MHGDKNMTGRIDMPGEWILMLAVWLALSGGASAQTQPIIIGLSGPFSGPSAGAGYALRDGVKLAVAEINQSGGVMGGPIVLVERDDEAKVDAGVRIAREMVEQQHVVATVGFVNTDVALAADAVYEAAEIPVLNAVATGTRIARQFMPPAHPANYIFQLAANDYVQAGLVVQEAITNRHFKAPAILTDNTGYGRSARAAFKRALGALDVRPAVDETFNVGDTNMTAQLSRVQRGNADVILVFGQPPELVAVVNGMADLGWKLPIIGGWPLSTAAFMADAGFNGDGASMPQTYIQAGNTPKRAAFDAAYLRAYKLGRIISVDCVAQAYDSVYLLKAAIEQARSTEGPRIRDALEHLQAKVEGVVTTYDKPFSPTDHEAISARIPIFGVVRNRHVVAEHEIEIEGVHEVRMK